jgi:hypothetical protein
MDLPRFLAVYGDTLLLIVRALEGHPDLAYGLEATSVRGSGGAPVRAVASSMEFHTAIHSSSTALPIELTERDRGDAARLEAWLGGGTHFALPLRKRSGADAAFRERISVGRARNKDVVLRHPSVSKFHGWFEVDEFGAFQLFDAGSTNGTQINGKPVNARVRSPLASGDLIRFGSIETMIVSPRTVWSALREMEGGASR